MMLESENFIKIGFFMNYGAGGQQKDAAQPTWLHGLNIHFFQLTKFKGYGK